MEGIELLLHRAQRLEYASDEERNEAANVVITLDFFPLALDQAGAYIEEKGCSLGEYLQVYQIHRKVLLSRRGLQVTNYPDSVATTWSLSFQKVERANRAAAELLRLCAFLEPDSIPVDLISKGSAYLGLILRRAARNVFTLNEAIEELRRFSLIQRDDETKMLYMHHLVQAVLKDGTKKRSQYQWAKRALQATSAAFPEKVDMETWLRCQYYLPPAQSCTHLIQEYALDCHEATSLLHRTANYLQEHALYELAASLYYQALRIRIQTLGPHHPDVAKSLHNLASLHSRQGNLAQAELLYQQALRILESALGSDSTQAGYALNGLLNLYYKEERYEKQSCYTSESCGFGNKLWGQTILI
ncbi:MAG TPA: tetratricopeptide repeat protein [Ktedonobacteraceae bacterium]|nr:tetratricopeptide repeat protein [Ktedonobacteraceae bacterium]